MPVRADPRDTRPTAEACEPTQSRLTSGLTLVMAVSAGLVVANLYYNQPLLADMGRTFGASVEAMGSIPMLTQLGYALGLLLLVPLGDALERRGLVVGMCIAAAGALAAAASAPGFAVLAVASLAIGFASIVPQLLVPFAASLADPQRRGRAVGTVMSGLLVGILLARTASGVVGARVGWRAMYWIAAGLMLVLAATLRALLPTAKASTPLRYRELMGSLWGLARREPLLRESALVGAMHFGAFSAFWATLVFRLEGPPYGYGAEAAGMFGLIGVVGVAAAPVAGRLSDRVLPRAMLRVAMLTMLAGYAFFWLRDSSLWGLVAGVVLLDAGAQIGHITNQGRIYRLPGEVHNRVNSVYMVSCFAGGALGSWLAANGFERYGWPAVCAVGAALLGIGLLRLSLPARAAEHRGG